MPSPNDEKKDQGNFPQFPHQDVIDNIRRFADHHISSMLHSLIGLPSVLSVPAATERSGNSPWANFEDERVANRYSQPRNEEEVEPKNRGRRSGCGGAGNNGQQDDDNEKSKNSMEAAKQKDDTLTPRDRRQQQKILALSFPLSLVALDLFERSIFDNFHDAPFGDVFDCVYQFGKVSREEMMEEMMRRFFVEESMQEQMGNHHHPFWGFGWIWNHPNPWLLTSKEARERLLREQENRRRELLENDERDIFPFSLFDEVRKRWEEEEHHHRRKDLLNFFESKKDTEDNGKKAEKKEQETELDLYEHFFGRTTTTSSSSIWNNNGKSQSESRSASTEIIQQFTSTSRDKHIIASSTSSSTRTLPDGSFHTKVVTEKRYNDGTLEREVKESSHPAPLPLHPPPPPSSSSSHLPTTLPPPVKEEETNRITDVLDDKDDWDDFDFEDEENDVDDDYVLEQRPWDRNYRNYATKKEKEEKHMKGASFKDYQREFEKTWNEAGRSQEKREPQIMKKMYPIYPEEGEEDRKVVTERNVRVVEKKEDEAQKKEKSKSGGSGWFWTR